MYAYTVRAVYCDWSTFITIVIHNIIMNKKSVLWKNILHFTKSKYLCKHFDLIDFLTLTIFWNAHKEVKRTNNYLKYYGFGFDEQNSEYKCRTK